MRWHHQKSLIQVSDSASRRVADLCARWMADGRDGVVAVVRTITLKPIRLPGGSLPGESV